jgi:hypothetical protein
MAISFGALKAVVIRLTADEINTEITDVVTGKVTSAELLKDAISSGLRAILPWAWKTKVYSIVNDTTALELPSDVYRVEGVYDSNNNSYLNETIMSAGYPRASEAGNIWLEYPEGYLTFGDALDNGGDLYYAAYWAEPTLDDEIIEAPAMIIPGLAFYAASYCLLPRALSAGNLGQYKMKVDSGVPTDNPIMDMSNAFMKRFELEMSRIPGRTRGIKS